MEVVKAADSVDGLPQDQQRPFLADHVERALDGEDPAILAEAAGRMAGIDFLREVQAGSYPVPPSTTPCSR